MNKNSKNIRKSPCQVLSKYFVSSPVMDESLSEFKEKKTGYTGPKNSGKTGESKTRLKKAPKRIRGQKDIRTALKSKKNELLNYAKQFDEVCRESGVDVDPEQLQLAIALSKSVQSSESNDTQVTQSLNSNERNKKIRTTLQEYGFCVPEVKIASSKSRKKKYNKNAKLLLATAEEKHQIISDKYAQVLFENVHDTNLITTRVNLIENNIYNLSTSIPYSVLKNNDVLYVQNLLEKSSSKGSLLRDWASIPGRPESPKASETLKMNFSEIECSQEDLDIVLSGTIRSAKSIINNKIETLSTNVPIVIVDDDVCNVKADGPITKEQTYDILKTNKHEFSKTNDSGRKVDLKDEGADSDNSSLTNRVRSCSPDIFEDEVSIGGDCKKLDSKDNSLVKDDFMDLTSSNCNISRNVAKPKVNNCKEQYIFDNNSVTDLTEARYNKVEDDAKENNLSNIRDKNDIVMDLTDIYSNNKLKEDYILMNSTHFTQTKNYTRKLSNDFMEITDCIAGPSHINTNSNELSKSNLVSYRNKTRRDSNDVMEITECVGKTQSNICIEDNIDLTQNCDENQVMIVENQKDDHIDTKVVDLSQSSHSEDEFPFVEINGGKNRSLDDTILLNSNEVMVNNDPVISIDDVVADQRRHSKENSSNSLIETSPSSTKITNVSNSANHTFFEEFVHNHSEETSIESSNKSSCSKNSLKISNDNEDVDVDLTQSYQKYNLDGVEVDITQSSNSSVDTPIESVITPVKSSLGKKDEISIDYDELFDEITKSDIDTNTKSHNETSESIKYDIADDNDEKTSENCSQASQVFDLCDQELEYSLNQSKNNLPWEENFGGISVIENMAGVEKRKTGNENELHFRGSMSDSCLPIVNIKRHLPKVTKNNYKMKDAPKTLENEENTNAFPELAKENGSTPYKACATKNAFIIDTPRSNSEYVIKTDQVTPMLDYASMSTPERNRELDKYGLKPFKRKRAIQLLTHLYTQTHPVVETCQEDQPSPSKKRKFLSQPETRPSSSPQELLKTSEKPASSTKNTHNSPVKLLKSPRKLSKSPKKSSKSPRKLLKSPKNSQKEIIPDLNDNGDLYEVTNELPLIRAIECSEEDWVFQKREKAKLHSCRVPLHIALHNYVMCRRRLREAILKYEPVNIDVIHKELAASGFRYDPKDLLKYMDKKCITVKTADNNARNGKR